MRALRLVLALAAIAACSPVGQAAGASLQPIGNFDSPIYVTSDPGDAGRLFVVERGGLVEKVEGGTVTTFADLSAAVGCAPAGCGGERGLLSIALSPGYESNGRLFADYAGEPDGTIQVVELTVSGGSALGSIPRALLAIPHPGEDNHNGGQLQFGPEGDLFVSTGDGGGGNDEHHNSQSLTSLLGKILRIDPNPSGVLPYTVPAGNPFAGTAPAPYDTIWSYGLRNPFRFSFDRGGSGIWIGDVGQSKREEVDRGAPPGLGGGANYGWNCLEGMQPGPADDPGCSGAEASEFTAPVFEYPHTDPGNGAAHGCAIIGGYVVRDEGLAGLYGRYLYGDLCSGELRSFAPSNPAGSDRSEGLEVTNLNSFGEDACGRLYAVSGDGAVSRLVGSQPTPCASEGGPLHPAFAGIRAFNRRVERGKRALLTVWVSPCAGRQGERVHLFRGNRNLGSHRLSRACTAQFRPRIRRRSSFRSRIAAGDGFEAATSRRLTIKPHHQHRRRR
ncbi:MAG TPA: PQQ-dependent sugar dehydrogenase [Solirubrobacterales bacterium]|nr:PQQ-dependent sugar dehydrogenase [Solirubrobacterales bacterium]